MGIERFFEQFIDEKTISKKRLLQLINNLLTIIDQLEELRRENVMIKKRGEAMAIAIEYNEWTIDSAERFADALSGWREFEIS